MQHFGKMFALEASLGLNSLPQKRKKRKKEKKKEIENTKNEEDDVEEEGVVTVFVYPSALALFIDCALYLKIRQSCFVFCAQHGLLEQTELVGLSLSQCLTLRLSQYS